MIYVIRSDAHFDVNLLKTIFTNGTGKDCEVFEDPNNVLSKIEQTSSIALEKKKKEKQKKINEIKTIYEQAKKLLPEVQGLCAIVNTAIDCGYCIVDSGGLTYSRPDGCPELCTDDYRHKLGFYGQSMVNNGYIDFSVRYDKIGYKNGGCDGNYHFTVEKDDIYFGAISFSTYDPDYKVFGQEYWPKGVEQLNQFIKDFPKFKERVYEFVDNIEQYKCWK